ncbi:MAG: hypothetical protein JW808_07665 [Victivallales bacterium]|nr:hypothetical protein [Victivallales bacterium]
MNNSLQIVFILMIVANFAIIASSRIRGCIKLLSLQGVILSLVPFSHLDIPHALFFCTLILVVKALVFPALLQRALRVVRARRETEPIVGYSASIMLGLGALIFSFWLCGRMNIAGRGGSELGISAAVFTIYTGLFIIIARVKAITQVVGYVVFENGIYLLGSSLMLEQNILVELGVILDLLVFVLLSGIVVFHINKEFDHIDTNSMSDDGSAHKGVLP